LGRLEPDQAVAAPEGVRRQVIGSTATLAPLDVRQPVAGEDHQVREALVDPEGGWSHARSGPAAAVALEVGETVVESRRTDRPRLAKVQSFVRD
jgi:hypothetical protein